MSTISLIFRFASSTLIIFGMLVSPWTSWATTSMAETEKKVDTTIIDILDAYKHVTLNFNQIDVNSFIAAISKLIDKEFSIPQKLQGNITLISNAPVTRDDAYQMFLEALRTQGLIAIPEDNYIKIIPITSAKGQIPLSTHPHLSNGQELAIKIHHLNYESVTQMATVLRSFVGPQGVVLPYPNSNAILISDFSDNISRLESIIIELDTPYKNDITIVTLQNTPLSDISSVIAKLFDNTHSHNANSMDLGQKVSAIPDYNSNSIIIRSASSAQREKMALLIRQIDELHKTKGSQFHVVYLKHANATTLANSLKNLLQAANNLEKLSPTTAINTDTATNKRNNSVVSGAAKGVFVQADTENNAILIYAPEVLYRDVRNLIDRMDIRRAQIFIESLIVEISTDLIRELGLQAQLSDPLGVLLTNFVSPATGGIQAIAQGTSANNSGIIAGHSSTKNNTNLSMLTRALESDVQTNVLSTPNIMALDNEEAKIVVGQNVPFITGQYTSSNSNSNSGSVNPFQTIERHDVGLTLRVQPQIIANDTIKMVLYQEVSNLSSQAGSNSNSSQMITNKRAIESTVLVNSGQVIVIGGLIQSRMSNSETGIPLLRSIPILGHLFKKSYKQTNKTNLMIFIKPTIIRTAEEGDHFTHDRYQYLDPHSKSQIEFPKTAFDASVLLETLIARQNSLRKDASSLQEELFHRNETLS